MAPDPLDALLDLGRQLAEAQQAVIDISARRRALIADLLRTHRPKHLCEVLGVSRTALYRLAGRTADS